MGSRNGASTSFRLVAETARRPPRRHPPSRRALTGPRPPHPARPRGVPAGVSGGRDSSGTAGRGPRRRCPSLGARKIVAAGRRRRPRRRRRDPRKAGRVRTEGARRTASLELRTRCSERPPWIPVRSSRRPAWRPRQRRRPGPPHSRPSPAPTTKRSRTPGSERGCAGRSGGASTRRSLRVPVSSSSDAERERTPSTSPAEASSSSRPTRPTGWSPRHGQRRRRRAFRTSFRRGRSTPAASTKRSWPGPSTAPFPTSAP